MFTQLGDRPEGRDMRVESRAAADERCGNAHPIPNLACSNCRSAMEIIEHRGHTITLDVADRGKGWTWTYQVDSGPVIANAGGTHVSANLARLEAIAVAEREIDSVGR